MAPIQIMSVVGSAVPRPLREQGLLACWYLLRDGEAVSGPLTTRSSAERLAGQMANASLIA